MYYVYEHWLDGKCFYVGKGRLKRARNLAFRSEKWLEYVKDRKKEIEIKLVESFEDESAAYKFEEEHTIIRRKEGHPLVCIDNGKAKSEETKKKQSNTRKGMKTGKDNPVHRSVVQLTKGDEYIKTFDTAVEACRTLNIHYSNLIQCCRGNRGSTGGFKWMYIEDYVPHNES